MEQFLLLPLGILVGAFGTLIGAGGGFLLVPVLLLLFPDWNSGTITSISMVAVFFNALSGTIAYARQGRIDYRAGLLFAGCAIPGAVLGTIAVHLVSRSVFNLFFGLMMVAVSLFLLLNPLRNLASVPKESTGPLIRREITDKNGRVHQYAYNPVLGSILSSIIGVFSSFLGIGGGVFHVPTLTYLLNFPVHLATATSQFILMIMSLCSSLVHITTGTFHTEGILLQTILLSAGVCCGAQLGALLSNQIQGRLIMQSLAVALGIIGIRILGVFF